MSVARLLCSPPVLTTKAVLHPAVLPGCEEQFDWLLVTLSSMYRVEIINLIYIKERITRTLKRSLILNLIT